MSLFEQCCTDIQAEYQRLGHSIGWRFLSGPKANLAGPSDLAFISLNPGGRDDPPWHPHGSQEKGSAYLVESWDGMPPGQSNLQIQVKAMFQGLATRRSVANYQELMNNTLMGYFIPFRSPNLASLNRKSESIAFGRRLWSGIFDHIAPRLIITIDNQTYKQISCIVRDHRPGSQEEAYRLPTGWGDYMADVSYFRCGNDRITIARLPHLSRFGIFTSQKCRNAVPALMDAIAS